MSLSFGVAGVPQAYLERVQAQPFMLAQEPIRFRMAVAAGHGLLVLAGVVLTVRHLLTLKPDGRDLVGTVTWRPSSVISCALRHAMAGQAGGHAVGPMASRHSLLPHLVTGRAVGRALVHGVGDGGNGARPPAGGDAQGEAGRRRQQQ
jgi:hypothetical protein